MKKEEQLLCGPLLRDFWEHHTQAVLQVQYKAFVLHFVSL